MARFSKLGEHGLLWYALALAGWALDEPRRPAYVRDADITHKKTSLLYVQALKFIQTKATPEQARRRTARPGEGARRAAGTGTGNK